MGRDQPPQGGTDTERSVRVERSGPVGRPLPVNRDQGVHDRLSQLGTVPAGCQQFSCRESPGVQ